MSAVISPLQRRVCFRLMISRASETVRCHYQQPETLTALPNVHGDASRGEVAAFCPEKENESQVKSKSVLEQERQHLDAKLQWSFPLSYRF